MIAYKREWLTNLRIQEQAEKYRNKNYVSPSEYEAIKTKYPVGFYTPNVFVRAGLFILTFLIMLMGDGLLTLMFGGQIIDSPAWYLFLGLLSYGCLEAAVALKYHFRSGVDDGLLFVTAILFTAGISFMLEKSASNDAIRNLWLSFFLFITTLCFTIRFIDRLMAVICCISFFATIFFLWNNIGFGGLQTAPFVFIFLSACAYWLISRYAKKTAFIDHEGCMLIGKIISLIVLYAAGNYYVVQTLGSEYGLVQTVNKPLQFAPFFWSWTMLVPLIYVALGIIRKDAVFLRLGLLLVIASIATFRTYYHILPMDIMLTVAGALVITIAWVLMRYLKTPKYGFTYEEPDEKTMMDCVRVESLVTAQSVANMPTAPSSNPSRLGGGDFGGGGSSGSF